MVEAVLREQRTIHAPQDQPVMWPLSKPLAIKRRQQAVVSNDESKLIQDENESGNPVSYVPRPSYIADSVVAAVTDQFAAIRQSAELLQVYGGQSDMLFSVHVANGRIFSGARDGSVSCVKLDLRVYHPCKWKDCSLKFGIVSHLKSHIQEYHVVQEGTIRACHWIKCQHTFLQEDGITAVLEHILSHADTSKTRTPS